MTLGAGWPAALARACHPVPTVAVTAIATAFAWILGWHGAPLLAVAACVLVGQLSVGWGNDAHDAAIDRAAGRAAKPAASGQVGPRTLQALAVIALVAAVALSWAIAGWVGGSFHVVALAAAWAYNLRLSRTAWSWLPYAVAFGCLPPFLTYGLDGRAPPAWLPAAFAITAVGGHLANALPDLEHDRATGLDGLAVRLGARRTEALAWALLAVGTGIAAVAGLATSVWPAAALTAAYLIALGATRTGHIGTFHALVAVVVVDAVAIAALTAAR